MRWVLDLKVSLAFVLLVTKSFHLLFAIDTSSGRGQLGKFSNDVSMETRQRVTCVLSLNTGKSLLLSFTETLNDVKTYPNQGDFYLLFPSLVNYRMYLMQVSRLMLIVSLSACFVVAPHTFTAQEAHTACHEWKSLSLINICPDHEPPED